jgi:hypothetical protein
LLIDENLGVVVASCQFGATRDQRFHQFRHACDGSGHEGCGNGASAGVHGIDQQQTIRREKLTNHTGKRRAHAFAGPIRTFHQGIGFFGKWQPGQCGAQFGEWRVFQNDAANRTGAVPGGVFRVKAHGAVVGAEYPGVIDLGEIVIFGGEPEYRDGGDAASVEFPGDPDGRERFVNGIGRARKQANLLAGDDGDHAGAREFFERRIAVVQGGQSADDIGTALVGKRKAGGLGGLFNRVEAVGTPGVEILNLVEIIDKVGEQF